MFRLFYIFYLLSKYSLILLLSKYGLRKTRKPKLIRQFFEEASGTFIKFGQMLALRVDIVSREYSLELLGLFDNVKPFSYKEVEETFLDELGATPDKIFKVFSRESFASASFGQVHGAKLRSNKTVIVKILRPGIEIKAHIDFLIIDLLAAIADLFVKIEALSWKEFAAEFKEWTKKEFDYRIEAENGERLYRNHINNENIFIPKIFHELTTKKILVEEYVDGLQLNHILTGLKDGRLDDQQLKKMGIDLKKVARTLIWELQKQFFFHEFYHADPHPGNIILLRNGKIALIDFGIVGGEPLPNKKYFVKWAKATGDFDFKKASYWAAHFAGDELKIMARSALPATAGEKAVDGLIGLLADHFSDIAREIVTENLSNLTTLKKDYITLLMQITKTAKQYRVKLPKEFVVFGRSLAIFGLLAKHLDPDFRLTEEMKNFFQVYSEEEITKNDQPPLNKRINREVAIEAFGNWLTYIYEVDQPVYNIVKKYLSQYNILDQ
ncbi:hypothetical protein A3J19_01280 [Candidatus Daviesbacteria bacterium RIFCSPLOWO2_02_FULL_41_8]|uniref:ABC1 atypical kinase-like domain-containing protein n=2 Tax=Candidatus Daviesiibacteriota TaxID=1752718 RepID=A0A1F5NK51_9BACT|nr:MAG: hypothetical protein A2871_02860 [Candidatus Daviesbacteria bacterium RIFCSPHIGHO2_01_FULL_41_23]OGE78086.1 MAG: hypothetical protein A3J19_01280 [Candidatus Daviesbacteria bacterium RIFCSPLOWO2_02_FULL_41_8]